MSNSREKYYLTAPIDRAGYIDFSHCSNVLEAIKLLLDTLPLGDQRRILDNLKSQIQPIDTPRSGTTLSAIVRWIPRDSAWTVNDVKYAVSQQGIPTSPKEIYNALSYLTRKRYIRRIGYGRYIVDKIPAQQ